MIKYIYDHTYDAQGWFDPMLTQYGWLDDEFSRQLEQSEWIITQGRRRKHRL